jgi:hypothetical protein
MTAQEVATLIETMADSLAKAPHQFNLDVKVEMSALKFNPVIHGPGAGPVVGQLNAPQMSGGSFTGVEANQTIGDVEIRQAEEAGEAAFDDAVQPMIAMLRELAQAVENEPSKVPTLRAKLGKVATAVPVLLATIDAALPLVQ